MKAPLIALSVLLVTFFTASARDISTITGQTYRAVTVTRVEKIGIGISHRDGAAFLDFSILPPAIQREFGYTKPEYDLAMIQQRENAQLAQLAAETQRRIAAETAAKVAGAQRLEAEKQAATAAAALAAAQALSNPPVEAASTQFIANRDYSRTDYTTRTYTRPTYSSTNYSGGSVQVRGYTRKDGTYVRPHTRRK